MPPHDRFQHKPEDVAASFVWTTVQNQLPPSRAVIQQELAGFDPPRDGKQ